MKQWNMEKPSRSYFERMSKKDVTENVLRKSLQTLLQVCTTSHFELQKQDTTRVLDLNPVDKFTEEYFTKNLDWTSIPV